VNKTHSKKAKLILLKSCKYSTVLTCCFKLFVLEKGPFKYIGQFLQFLKFNPVIIASEGVDKFKE